MIQAEFRKYIINDIKSRQNLGSRQGWKISDDVQIQLSFAQANVDQKYFKVYSQLKQLLPSLFCRWNRRSCVVRYCPHSSLVISQKIIFLCSIIYQELKIIKKIPGNLKKCLDWKTLSWDRYVPFYIVWDFKRARFIVPITTLFPLKGSRLHPIHRLVSTTFVDVLKVLFDSDWRIEFGKHWWVMRSLALF